MSLDLPAALSLSFQKPVIKHTKKLDKKVGKKSPKFCNIKYF